MPLGDSHVGSLIDTQFIVSIAKKCHVQYILYHPINTLSPFIINKTEASKE